jgi:hypothetical protein
MSYAIGHYSARYAAPLRLENPTLDAYNSGHSVTTRVSTIYCAQFYAAFDASTSEGYQPTLLMIRGCRMSSNSRSDNFERLFPDIVRLYVLDNNDIYQVKETLEMQEPGLEIK